MCEGAFNWPGLRCLLHPTPGVSVGRGGIVWCVCDHPRVSAGQKLALLSQLPLSWLCIRFNQSETAANEEQGMRNGNSTWRSVKKNKTKKKTLSNRKCLVESGFQGLLSLVSPPDT